MIDTDGVPHLPKLGSALNKIFIETYWAYKGAIFHPHNEFIITKDDYQSLVGLLYSDNKQLLNYNDMYFILMIEGIICFDSNDNLNNKVKKNFLEKLKIKN